MKINDKVEVNKDIPSINGMLHKGTIVRVDEISLPLSAVRGNIRVVDDLGKIWFLNEGDIK
jgi:ribosomal protein L30/L7E|tara:strand:- start:239 stop:421 length:183 start_codon:yes stop_codon:yes gene_type:complete